MSHFSILVLSLFSILSLTFSLHYLILPTNESHTKLSSIFPSVEDAYSFPPSNASPSNLTSDSDVNNISSVQIDELIEKGNDYYNQSNYNESITYYDKALAIDPYYLRALNNKGNALGELGKSEEAITWYDKALEVDPKDVDVLNNKGWVLSNLGKYDEAITWYDKALDIDPNYINAQNNKEEALSKLDN